MLGVAGWVRNNPDGAVEVLAMGTRRSVVHTARGLQQGPRAARVDAVDESEAPLKQGIEDIPNRRSLVNGEKGATEVRDALKKLIREVPDFPKKGILFYDITTLLKDKVGFATLIDVLAERFIGESGRSGPGDWKLAALSSVRRWLIALMRALCRCASRASSLPLRPRGV